jgi:thiamine pyrophosphokinase
MPQNGSSSGRVELRPALQDSTDLTKCIRLVMNRQRKLVGASNQLQLSAAEHDSEAAHTAPAKSVGHDRASRVAEAAAAAHTDGCNVASGGQAHGGCGSVSHEWLYDLEQHELAQLGGIFVLGAGEMWLRCALRPAVVHVF